MPDFHDVRLPVDVEQGAHGGPGFKTTIFPLASGHEQRNIDWERTRADWEVGYGIMNNADFSLVKDFFYARHGRAYSFRFKDWSDYLISRQVIGTTDTTTDEYQLFKRYSSGGYNFDRIIYKPTATGALVWVNSVAQTVVYDAVPAATEVAVNTLTGIVTLGSTHAVTTGQSIEIECEFDTPVRFDTDKFEMSLTHFEAGAVPRLPVKEVKGE